MYTPEHFRNNDPQAAVNLMRAYPFAVLITMGKDGLAGSHVPTLLKSEPEPHGVLECHLARANTQWADFDASVPALMIFSGPEAYVRPGWYPSKAEHGKVVPTWNYTVVHAYGQLTVHDDRDWLVRHVAEISQSREAQEPKPWATSDAPDGYIAALSRGIVGLSLSITRLEAKWKLSQNRPAADHAGVIDGLQERNRANDDAVAHLMRDREG